MANKWLSILKGGQGVIEEGTNPFTNVLRTQSPSVNFTFGNTHGLPCGYSLVVYGPPKAGKTALINSFIGQMHLDYADALALKFDTEFRDRIQMTPNSYRIFNIDKERYFPFERNDPGIFDFIFDKVPLIIKEGGNVKLIVIDSINSIVGRRTMDSKSVMNQQIGDEAKTIQDGLKRILPVIRKYNIALILSTQLRAEMDMTEQMRGNKVKMAASFATKHFGEYFMYVEPVLNKDGKVDLLGNELVSAEMKNGGDKAEQVAHHIKCTMKDSSMGPKKRVGMFTFHYTEGVINTHEEIYTIARDRGIITKPSNTMYAFGDKKWRGEAEMVMAIQKDKELANAILASLRERDIKDPYGRMENNQAEESELKLTDSDASDLSNINSLLLSDSDE